MRSDQGSGILVRQPTVVRRAESENLFRRLARSNNVAAHFNLIAAAVEKEGRSIKRDAVVSLMPRISAGDGRLAVVLFRRHCRCWLS